MGLGSRVQFARAGPDMSPEVESLIKKATKQAKYQRRRGFQLPEHDVGLSLSLQSIPDCTCRICTTSCLGRVLSILGFDVRRADTEDSIH